NPSGSEIWMSNHGDSTLYHYFNNVWSPVHQFTSVGFDIIYQESNETWVGYVYGDDHFYKFNGNKVTSYSTILSLHDYKANCMKVVPGYSNPRLLLGTQKGILSFDVFWANGSIPQILNGSNAGLT